MKMFNDWLSLLIQSGTFVTMIYALTRFMSKPNQTQNDRIAFCEKQIEAITRRLDNGTTHFRHLDTGNAQIFDSLLAIMDALITLTSDGDKEELTEQRKKLYKYTRSIYSDSNELD